MKNFYTLLKVLLVLFAPLALAQSQTYKSTYWTPVHEGLNIEQERKNVDKTIAIKKLNEIIDAAKADQELTNAIVEYKKYKSVSDSLEQIKRAPKILSATHEIFKKSTNYTSKKQQSYLCDALCADINGTCTFDCDTSAFVYVAILYTLFDKVTDYPFELLAGPGHVVLIWSFSDGSSITWDTMTGEQSRDPDYNKLIYQRFKVNKDEFYAIFYYNRATTAENTNTKIDYYTKAIQKKKDFIFAYCNRGYLLEKSGKYNRALSDYIKTIELNPTDLAAHQGLGRVYYELGKYKKAISAFTDVIALLEKQGEQVTIGAIHKQEDNYAEAYRYRSKAKSALGNDWEGAHYDAVMAGDK